MEKKEIKIAQVKEVTTKDGKKFTAYKAVAKNNKLIDCRFTRDVEEKAKPTEPCVIVVDDESSSVDTRGQYPVLWVRKIDEIKPLPKKNNLAEYFE